MCKMDDVEALDFYIDAAEDAHVEGIEGVFQALVTPGIEGLLEIIDVQPDAEAFHTNPSILAFEEQYDIHARSQRIEWILSMDFPVMTGVYSFKSLICNRLFEAACHDDFGHRLIPHLPTINRHACQWMVLGGLEDGDICFTSLTAYIHRFDNFRAERRCYKEKQHYGDYVFRRFLTSRVIPSLWETLSE
jgi:hypothetical protein